MNTEEVRKHVLYDMCVSIVVKASMLPPDDLQEVIVALRSADKKDSDDQKALTAIAEALAPYIDL